MAQHWLSKWIISLFIMANMIWRMFDPARLSFALHRARDQSRPNPGSGTTFSSSEWVQIADLVQGDGVTPTLKSTSSIDRFAVSEFRRALDLLGSVAGFPLCVGYVAFFLAS